MVALAMAMRAVVPIAMMVRPMATVPTGQTVMADVTMMGMVSVIPMIPVAAVQTVVAVMPVLSMMATMVGLVGKVMRAMMAMAPVVCRMVAVVPRTAGMMGVATGIMVAMAAMMRVSVSAVVAMMTVMASGGVASVEAAMPRRMVVGITGMAVTAVAAGVTVIASAVARVAMRRALIVRPRPVYLSVTQPAMTATRGIQVGGHTWPAILVRSAMMIARLHGSGDAIPRGVTSFRSAMMSGRALRRAAMVTGMMPSLVLTLFLVLVFWLA